MSGMSMLLGRLKQDLPKTVKRSLRVLGKILSHLKIVYVKRTTHIHSAPILISGNPKSGTTAIAVLLGKATGKSVTSDVFYRIDNEKGPFRERLFNGELTFRDLIRQNKLYFATDIIKDPNFVFFHYAMRKCFPNGRFIFIVRDPRDNIRSILNRLDVPGNLRALEGAYKESYFDRVGWKLVMEGRLPDVAGATYIERLANRWNLVVETYIDHQDDMVLIRYEDFVKDKAGVIAQLARQVGLIPRRDITAFMDVQYQPRGDHSITWSEFFGVDNLHRIETICSSRMSYFGYKPSDG